MTIILNRILHKGEIIEGRISIDGLDICDTLENLHNILPPGSYTIEAGKCQLRHRKMPLIITGATPLERPCEHCAIPEMVGHNTTPHYKGEEGRPIYCPQLTPGNGIIGRHDGSILVGQRASMGLLIHPKSTFDLLYERLRKCLERGNPITLIIQQ